MLYQRLIRLIEDHAEQLTLSWIKEVRSNPSSAGYKNISTDELNDRIFTDLRMIHNYISQDPETIKKIARHYISLGQERAAENMKQSEVIYAMILLKGVLWQYIMEQGFIDNAIHLYQALEFFNLLNNFFDKAIYFISVGYETLYTTKGVQQSDDTFIERAISSVTNWFLNYNEVR